MFNKLRSALAKQTLWGATEDVAPWHRRFQQHVREMPRLDRLTLNMSLLFRLPIRDFYGQKHLSGHGIEIGAQYVPTKVGANASVEYVDVLSNDELVSRYRLPADGLVPLAHVIDGHHLTVYQDGQLSFLIAHHVLEHFDDPMRGLVEWLRVIKDGGILFLTLPNYRGNAFDYERKPVGADHFLLDYQDPEGREARNREHYEDMAASLQQKPHKSPEVQSLVKQWLDCGDRHHYHVWDQASLRSAVSVAAQVSQCDLSLVDGFMPNSGFELLIMIRKKSNGSGRVRWISKATLALKERVVLALMVRRKLKSPSTSV